VARNKGVPVPEGALIDGRGLPTTDPRELVDDHKGALLAFGQHKGSGLAVMCEVLGAAMIGGQTIAQQHQGGVLNSMMATVIDAGRFGPAERVQGDVGAVKDWIKASPPAPGFSEVLLPGEPERRSRAKRDAEGIPLDDKSWADIVGAGVAAGLDRADLERTALG
jgi:uncharacterized oxidoreductase